MRSSTPPSNVATGASNDRPVCRRDRRREVLGDDHRAAVDVVGAVLEVRVERDREVRRDRPGRRRPDQHRDVAAGQRGHARRQVGARCRRSAGTRRRSTARCAARTRPPPRPAPCGSGCTSARASCPCRPCPARRSGRARARSPPGTERHRQVGVVPLADDAEALEVAALDARRTSRRTPGTRGGSRPCVISRFFGPSSRSTFSSIGRPWQSHPGTYGRVEAGHGLRLDDEVLQDLVERRADVDLAVGVRADRRAG